MRILPVVERELRAISRRPSAYWVRSAWALAAFAALGYVALIGAVGFPTTNQGRDLFSILSWGAFAYCLLAGIRGTSDALSFEKREGTLGLLFLTDLKGYDIVIGKLVSVSINSIYGILAIAPPLALAFLLGGTSATQFITMIVFLLNTLFFSLSVGMLVSTFSHNDRPAMGATLAIVFVMLVMPYGVAAAHSYGALEIWEVIQPGFLLTSPAFAFWSIKDPTLLRIYTDEIRLSIAFINLAGWLCLVIASASIAKRAYADAPRGKLVAWFIRVRQQWAYGKAERRRAIRSGLLDRNAFAWLAGRDRLKQRYAWIFLLALGALWLAARWKAPEVTEEWPATLVCLWLLHLFFKIWVGSEVAARFIEDRRSNALELLLTTPLKLREFVAGERLALLRQFGAPLAFIIFLNLFSGMRARDSSAYFLRSPYPMHFFGAGLVHLVFDLYAIQWVAIWRSMHLRGTNRTISQTISLIVFLPVFGWFMLWQGSWLAWMAMRRGGPSTEEILWTWTVLCVVYDLFLAFIAQNAFFRDFREAATKAFDKPARFSWKDWRLRRNAAARTEAVTHPRRRIARRIGIAIVILLACGYIAAGLRRHRLEAAVASRLLTLRTSNMPLSEVEAAAYRGAPAPSESGSLTLNAASKTFVASGYTPQLLDAQAHWNSREKLPAELKQRFQSWISTNAEVYRIFDQLPARKPGGPVTIGPYYRRTIAIDDLTRILQFKARVELEDDPRAAAKTITTLLHLARVMEGEEWSAISGTHHVMKSANDLLQRAALQGNLSAEDWRTWKAIIAQLSPIATLHTRLIVARASGLESLLGAQQMLFQNFGRQIGYPEWLFNVDWSIRRFCGQDKAEIIQYLDELAEDIALSERPFWEIRDGTARRSGPTRSFVGAALIAPQLLPAFDWMFNTATETVAYQRVLMTACDVEIYRAEHGSLPLDRDNFPAKSRIDPFSGNNLTYVTRDNGYSIYSVGENLLDDGGLRLSARHGDDIAFHCGKPPDRKSSIKNP